MSLAGGIAYTAAPAFLRGNQSLEFLGALGLDHLDGIKHTPIDACLAPAAQLPVNGGFIATLGKSLLQGRTILVNGREYQAAVPATGAYGNPHHRRGVPISVDETIICGTIKNSQSFLTSDLSAEACSYGMLSSLIDLNTVAMIT